MASKTRRVPTGRERLGAVVKSAKGPTVTLDVSRLEVQRFERATATNRPANARKRANAGLPPDEFLVCRIYLIRDRAEYVLPERLIVFELVNGAVHDIPATIRFVSTPEPALLTGDRIEFRLHWVPRADWERSGRS